VPPPGTSLFKENVEVGRITSSTFSDRRNAAVALIFVRVPQTSVGERILAKWEGGEEHLSVMALPFPSV
jgi:glycine cleavage system aminomethyltransferase T